MSFGEKLTKLRKEKGLNQEELAQELNVSRQAVSKWESNNSYPETDKIIQICKIFNVSMDELIGLKEVSKEKNNKFIDTFNKVVNEFIRAIKMFYKMTFTQKIKCLLEMFFYFVIIAIIFIVINILVIAVIHDVLSILPYEIIYTLTDTLEGILLLIYFILGTYLLVKLYKIRYLDYYEEIPSEIEIKDTQKEKEEKINIKEEKIIIRDSSNNFNPFTWLKMICKFGFKVFLAFLLIPMVIVFVFLLAFIIFVLYFINNGIILFYVALGLTGSLLLLYIFLELFIKIIFEMDLKPKKLLIVTLISLIIIGISGGLFACELSTYNIVYNKDVEKSKEIVIPLENNLIISYLDDYMTDIVYEDRDDILVEFYVTDKFFYQIKSYKNYINYRNSVYTFYDYYPYDTFSNMSFKNILDKLLENIKNKNIIVADDNIKIVIHISKNNYDLLKSNMRYYFDYE